MKQRSEHREAGELIKENAATPLMAVLKAARVFYSLSRKPFGSFRSERTEKSHSIESSNTKMTPPHTHFDPEGLGDVMSDSIIEVAYEPEPGTGLRRGLKRGSRVSKCVVEL